MKRNHKKRKAHNPWRGKPKRWRKSRRYEHSRPLTQIGVLHGELL